MLNLQIQKRKQKNKMKTKNTILIFLTLTFLLFLFGCSQKAEYAKPSSNVELTCVTSWSCGNWSGCSNGVQTRSCIDASNCKNISDKPKVTQPCNQTTSGSSSQSQTPIDPNAKSAKTGQNYIEKGQTVIYKTQTVKLVRVSDTAVLLNVSGNMETLSLDKQRSLENIKVTLVATFDTTAATIDFS